MPTTKKLHSRAIASVKTSIHVVSPFVADHTYLGQMLQGLDFTVTSCSNVEELTHTLKKEAPTLVLTEREFPDGTWRDILTRCNSLPVAPLVLVATSHADESLWGEVLNRGGYDVLAKPFDNSEVTRVIDMACHRCTNMWMEAVPEAQLS